MKKPKINWKKVGQLVKATDKSVLEKVIGIIDGHSIFDPKAFTELGLSEEIVSAFLQEHESGDNHKEQIANNSGVIVDSMRGVYGLQLLEFIASTFKVSSWKNGRGFRAAHLSEQLLEVFNVPTAVG